MAEQKEFRLKKAGDKRLVVWPVDVPVPVDDGMVEKQTLRARFQILPREELDRLIEQEVAAAFSQPAGKAKAKAKPENYGTPLLRVVVKGFVDFCEEDGAKPMPDAAAIPLLLGTPYVALALQAAYWDMMAGRARKN